MGEAKDAKVDAERKRQDIEAIRQTILASDENYATQEASLKENIAKKEEMSADYRGFFQKQEEISKQQNDLDKEIFRLKKEYKISKRPDFV